MTEPDIHREVLDNLEDGVLVVGLGGRIETLNPAAERMLGLEAREAAGRSFAELFILREGFDDFTQRLMDATTGDADGRRRVVELRSGEEARSLSVATSYLRRGEGGGKAVSAIAVFSDITELRELRETELRLARETENQHHRLQDACREIEDRNTALASALRKVRIVQGLGMGLALGLFVGAGLRTTRSFDLFEGAAAAASAVPDGSGRVVMVRSRRVADGITLRGRLAPWRVVGVRSPVSGTVETVHFRTGQEVAKGDALLELDLTRIKREYASARQRHALALKRVRELEDWDRSPEMLKARRSFTKARLDMESRRTAINKSRFLVREGLIPAAEHEDAERQFRGQELDFATAEEEFAAVRDQGNAAALEEARLDLEAAAGELQAAERALTHATIRAPIRGVVLASRQSGRGPEAGSQVSNGQDLVEIGDFSRMSADIQADEADVVKLRAGQKVTVTGDALRGLRIEGAVTHVSAQADPKSRGIPKFGVTVTLDPVGPGEAEQLRAGMSARRRVVTYDNPKALTVPIDAVESRGGAHRVRVVDPSSGEIEDRRVGIGPTARDSVEIRSGLGEGETILAGEG